MKSNSKNIKIDNEEDEIINKFYKEKHKVKIEC